MKKLISTILIVIALFVGAWAQEIPLVYDVENTGAEFAKPILPGFDDLPIIKPLTDPFEWSDGSGRDTTFASWSHRRAEIKAEIENYEIGIKPDRPDTITANYSNSVLTVNVTKNGKTLTLTSNITLPSGDGPFPAVIGMVWFAGSGGTGSLPSDIFTSRNIASIEFVHDQVTTYSSQNNSDPFYQLYPELNSTNTGQYSAWSWGVSRLIDGLELVQDVLPIDIKHLAVTGCSYAGKMALFAGAFDERIALTIAQESGGGGAPAWRVSETLGSVERLHSTDHNWFKESMFNFSYTNVNKLPEDHHELMAMCAPRALLVTGNTNYEWLANPSCYVSARATRKVYQTFGIEDRFGFYIDGGHGHCSIPSTQQPAIEKFVEKYLLGDTTVATNIVKHPYGDMDYLRWFQWWGTGDPVLVEEAEGVYYEVECGTVGSNWNIIDDAEASNGKCVIVSDDLENLSDASLADDDIISINFTADRTATYNIIGRVNCPTEEKDSFWITVDNKDAVMCDSLVTKGWEWKNLLSYYLRNGEHTLVISYRENGAMFDKVFVSTNSTLPDSLGEDAENLCDPSGIEMGEAQAEYFMLDQNYPNPFNPSTTIKYNLSESGDVILKIYNLAGEEVETLVSGYKAAGKHDVKWQPEGLSSGIYFYRLQSGEYSKSRKIIFQK